MNLQQLRCLSAIVDHRLDVTHAALFAAPSAGIDSRSRRSGAQE